MWDWSAVEVLSWDLEGGKLGALGLDGDGSPFEAVFAGEVVGALKPSPRLFERALEDLRVPAGGLVQIGDRDDTDAVAAVAAGCGALILGRDFDDFGELRRSLESDVGSGAEGVGSSGG